MPPEVACPERAEDRVGERMCAHVSVGMPAQTLVVLDLDPAENQPPAGFERMKVEAVAYSKTHRDSPTSAARAAWIALRPPALTIAISLAKLFSSHLS